jgi:hypothetical protein
MLMAFNQHLVNAIVILGVSANRSYVRIRTTMRCVQPCGVLLFILCCTQVIRTESLIDLRLFWYGVGEPPVITLSCSQ